MPVVFEKEKRSEVEAARGGLLEKAIGWAAPGWAARRELSRLQLVEARQKATMWESLGRGGFAGASRERGYSTWTPGSGSADAELLVDLPTLRDRCHDLVRNDPSAAGLKARWVEGIVSDGLSPQAQPDAARIGLSEDQALRFQEAAERVWRRWSQVVDVSQQLSAGDVQALVLGSLFEGGDCFVVPRSRPRRGRPYSLQLEVVEAERVATPASLASNPFVRDGVLKDARTHEPLRYYVLGQHRGDVRPTPGEQFTPVPAFDENGRRLIHHLFRMERPQQSRGYPLIAPGLQVFKDVSSYLTAELWSAKLNACISLYIVTPNPVGAAMAASASENGQRKEKLEPGTIKYLSQGQDVKSFTPNRPGDQFAEFLKKAEQIKGQPLQMGFEAITGDFSDSNYSSARASILEVRRVYKRWQRWFARVLLQPIYERLLTEAFLLGELPAPGFFEFFEDYVRAMWIGAGWSWVDPQKEVKAEVEAYAARLTTLQAIYANRGEDWQMALRQIAREEREMRELGIKRNPIEVNARGGEDDESDGDGAPPGDAGGAEDGGDSDGD